MKLLVHMKDGRTCFSLTGRGVLGRLVKAEPWGEDMKSVRVERGIWNPINGEYLWRNDLDSADHRGLDRVGRLGPRQLHRPRRAAGDRATVAA